MKVVSFDPGVSTGIAIGNSEINLRPQTLTVRWPDELVQFVYQQVYSTYKQLWVVESFNLFPQKAESKTFSSFPEVEVIGFLRGLTVIQPAIELISFTPGTYKPVARTLNIEKTPGMDRHQMDALQLYFYTERFVLPKRRVK